METSTENNGTWTRVSPDGKSAVARMSLGSGTSEKPGPGGSTRHFSTANGQYVAEGQLFAANTRIKTATDADGGPRRSPLGKGPERGKKVGKRYVLPPTVVDENKRIALVYSQKDGTLMDMEDRLVGKGYSGAPGNVNVPESQGKKDLGVIPQGMWTIGEVTERSTDTRGKGENLIHLEPDTPTSERVRAMGRDPNTFYIHAGKQAPNDRSASQGCIIMGKPERKALRELQGAKIRVVR